MPQESRQVLKKTYANPETKLCGREEKSLSPREGRGRRRALRTGPRRKENTFFGRHVSMGKRHSQNLLTGTFVRRRSEGKITPYRNERSGRKRSYNDISDESISPSSRRAGESGNISSISRGGHSGKKCTEGTKPTSSSL